MNQQQQAQYNWVRQMAQNGRPVAQYHCPDCSSPCFSAIPAAGDIYDSMVQCPHCEGLHFRITSPGGTVTIAPMADGHAG